MPGGTSCLRYQFFEMLSGYLGYFVQFEVAVDLTLLSVPNIITDIIKEWIVIYARTPATMVKH